MNRRRFGLQKGGSQEHGNKKCDKEEEEEEEEEEEDEDEDEDEEEEEEEDIFGLFGIAVKWPRHGCMQLF